MKNKSLSSVIYRVLGRFTQEEGYKVETTAYDVISNDNKTLVLRDKDNPRIQNVIPVTAISTARTVCNDEQESSAVAYSFSEEEASRLLQEEMNNL
jgi:hypothetical protein